MLTKKLIKIESVITATLLSLPLANTAYADTPNITAGLQNVDANTLASMIMKIGVGVAALAGVFAFFVLIFLGFKLKAAGERQRAEVLDHIKWVFIGLGVVGFAGVIVGFAAFLIQNNVK